MYCSRAALALFSVLTGNSAAFGGELEQLSWLSGCWANPKAEPGSGEYWQPLAGGTMLGVGRTVRNGKTVDYEFMRLHEDANGRVVYTATPARHSETPFTALQIGDSTATFENPGHDFPQKITYAREGSEHMLVRIEGERQGMARAIEFRFARVPCSR